MAGNLGGKTGWAAGAVVAVIVALFGAWGSGLLAPESDGDDSVAGIPRIDAEKVAEAAEQASAGDAEAVDQTPQDTPDNTVKPSIDVVRVEPDGATLVAGAAAPGAVVRMLVDGVSLAEETAGADGKFAAFLDLPPSADPRVISLSVEGAGGTVLSEQEVIVGPTPGAKVAQLAEAVTQETDKTAAAVAEGAASLLNKAQDAAKATLDEAEAQAKTAVGTAGDAADTAQATAQARVEETLDTATSAVERAADTAATALGTAVASGGAALAQAATEGAAAAGEAAQTALAETQQAAEAAGVRMLLRRLTRLRLRAGMPSRRRMPLRPRDRILLRRAMSPGPRDRLPRQRIVSHRPKGMLLLRLV